MAIVAEGRTGRAYVAPNAEHMRAANVEAPAAVAETSLPDRALGFRVQQYGMTKHRDLFTPRQLVALTTFSDLVGEARQQLLADGASEDYANAVATFVALAVNKAVDRNTSLCTWESRMDRLRGTFGRQALPMV